MWIKQLAGVVNLNNVMLININISEIIVNIDVNFFSFDFKGLSYLNIKNFIKLHSTLHKKLP